MTRPIEDGLDNAITGEVWQPLTPLDRMKRISPWGYNVVHLDGLAWATNGHIIIRLGEAAGHRECHLLNVSVDGCRDAIRKLIIGPRPRYALSYQRLYFTELDCPVREMACDEMTTYAKQYLIELAMAIAYSGYGTPAYWSDGPGKPIVVACGTAVVAILMPIRDRLCRKDSWREIESERDWLVERSYYTHYMRQEDGDDE